MDSGGRFEILEPLGAGALGRLYRARDARLGRVVALRVVSPGIAGAPSARDALFAEARKAAAFSHPHAAALLDIVVLRHVHEIVCLVHELAEGQRLSALLADGPVRPQLALELGAQVAEALAAGAQMGLLHGALDPDAIVVSSDGQAKVLDFGVSRWTACAKARAAAPLMLEGRECLPPEKPSALYYVSPEQLLGATVDARADVFALGAMLHEMLTGRPPFSGDSEVALFLQILGANPVPPSRLNSGIPGQADSIVRCALTKSLDHRYPTAAALAADLRELLAAPGVVPAAQAEWIQPVEVVQPTAGARPAVLENAVGDISPVAATPADTERGASSGGEPEPSLRPMECPPEAEPALAPAALFEPRREAPPPERAFTGFFDRSARPDDAAGGTDAVGAGEAGMTAVRMAPPAEASSEETASVSKRIRRDTETRAAPRHDRQGIRPAVWGMVAAAAVIVLLAGVAWFGRNALDLPWQDHVTAAARPYVMVTSFAVAGDNAPPYFGPGFAEDLAARLSEVPGATVVGRTSVREAPFASDWRARAKRAGASFLVRGSITPGPYALHADVELLDAGSGATVWSRHFAREPRQVAALQADIAGQLAQHLRLVTPTSNRWARASVRKTDPAAYDLYLQGRDAADKRDRARAIGLYDQALQRDPGLIEARAALSQAIYLEEYYAGGTRDSASSGRALREAEAALAVDAELPAAHLAAALSAPTITMAASSLARVLGFDPSNGEAWHHAGDLVSELDPPRSIPFYRASLALEPSIDANWRDLASAYAGAGDAAGAREAIARGEAARPDRPWWKQVRARLDVEQGRYDAAIQALGTDPSVESAPIVWLMGRVIPLAMSGRSADARREATRLVERYPAYCEGGAVLAAIERDVPAAAEQGRQRASAILEAAARPDAEPSMKVCAALAAAGTGDPAEAASWMSRLAGDERALRLWTRQAIFGPALSFRSRWYPWNKVMSSQPMQVAASQLDASLQRIRDEVARRLPAPPGSTPIQP